MNDAERKSADSLPVDVRRWQKDERAICGLLSLAGLVIAAIGFLVAYVGFGVGYYVFLLGFVVGASGIVCFWFSGTTSPPDLPIRRR